MPTIFAIDGVDVYDASFQDFAELGAYSSAVSALQTALVSLGNAVGDQILKVLVIDGLIGPKTTAATNRAFTVHIGSGQAPNKFRTGTLSQSSVAANASELAEIVSSEVQRRGGTSASTVLKTVSQASAPKTTAMVPYTPAATPSTLPGPAIPQAMLVPSTGDDTKMQIVKWAAIGLGLVVATAGVYYLIKGRRASGFGALPQQEADALEAMMDHSGGVSEVFDTIAEIANGKADHVRTNWQDERLARKWEAFARKMDKLAASTKDFEVR